MIFQKKFFLIFACSFFTTSLLFSQKSILPKQRNVTEIEVSKEKFHLYLLIGQSNMAGRGIVEPQDTIENIRILRLNRNGDWDLAKEPVQFDKNGVGVGPGLAFAREMLTADNDSAMIGLIPCAAGGSGIDVWLKDLFWEQTQSFPYNNAVLRAKLAMKEGVLKGILWHQGEADCNGKNVGAYKDKLAALIKKLRKELNVPDLPFIAGELPEFNDCAKNFNPVLYEIKDTVEDYDVVSGNGLTSNPDGVHLDAVSARELGRRYAEKMKQAADNVLNYGAVGDGQTINTSAIQEYY
jgi:hypothetical protein